MGVGQKRAKVLNEGAVSHQVSGAQTSGEGDTGISEDQQSLVLPSHERLVNYRKYISDQLDVTDVSKLDQRIHKQAGRSGMFKET